MEDMLTNMFGSRRASASVAAYGLTCVWQMALSGWHIRSERALSCISLTHTGPPGMSAQGQGLWHLSTAVCVYVFALVDKEQTVVKITLTTPLLSIMNVYYPTAGYTNIFTNTAPFTGKLSFTIHVSFQYVKDTLLPNVHIYCTSKLFGNMT